MASTKIVVEVPGGIDLKQVETIVQEGAAAAASDRAKLERRTQGIVEPFTLAGVALGSGIGGAMVRDVWKRYILPRLDQYFGVGTIKEHNTTRKTKSPAKATVKKAGAKKVTGKRKATSMTRNAARKKVARKPGRTPRK